MTLYLVYFYFLLAIVVMLLSLWRKYTWNCPRLTCFQVGFWYMPDKIFPNPAWAKFGRGYMRGPVPSRQDGCDCIRLAPSALSSNLTWDLHPQMPPRASTLHYRCCKLTSTLLPQEKNVAHKTITIFSGSLSWKYPNFPEYNNDGTGTQDEVLRRCRSSTV